MEKRNKNKRTIDKNKSKPVKKLKKKKSELFGDNFNIKEGLEKVDRFLNTDTFDKKDQYVLKENFIQKEKRSLINAYERFADEKFRHVFQWVFQIAVTLALAALCAIVFFQSVTVQESAMEPTLAIGEKFFVNRFVYRVSDPKRGDIIVFRTNGNDEAALHVRRVIGLPGETIQIVNGNIMINGEIYREAKDFPDMVYDGIAANVITLGENEYFVLGDNRNNSEDSRYGEIGNVDKKYITGKLWFKVSPLKKIGFLKG